MIKWNICGSLLNLYGIPVKLSEISAPQVDGDAAALMPQISSDFGQDLWYVIKHALQIVLPDLKVCCGICLSMIAATMLISLLQTYEGKIKSLASLCGVVCISCTLLGSTHTMIQLGVETVMKIGDYGKLLLPVLTAALAVQGGTTSSAVLYTATALFDALLSSLITGILIPMVYIYLVLSIVNAAVGDEAMQRMRNFAKSISIWLLKTLLYTYTGYISITGVISGTVDQAAVKAAKVTISSAVPVIGNIMADASESILVSAGVVKNSVGIYGLLAVIAIVAVPFLKIALQYSLLKITGAVCGLFADKKIMTLADDFSSVMGLLLAMTGVSCLLLLISIVCFLKGMG